MWSPCLGSQLESKSILKWILSVLGASYTSIPPLSLYRLCGKLPFHGEAGMKLEECIIDGHLTFREVEWINISEQGSSHFIAAPIRANRMVLMSVFSPDPDQRNAL